MPEADSAALLRRLHQLSVPPPEQLASDPRAGRSGASLTATQMLAMACFPFLAPKDEPALLPLLLSFSRMLRCWLAPLVCAPLLVVGVYYRSSLALLLSLASFINMCCDWQVRRTLWHPGPVKPGLYAADSARNRRLRAILESKGWTTARGCLGSGTPSLTPWLWNGDLLTLFPFLTYSLPQGVSYERVWFHAPAMGDGGGATYAGSKGASPESNDDNLESSVERELDERLAVLARVAGVSPSSTPVRRAAAQQRQASRSSKRQTAASPKASLTDDERPPECCALDWAFPTEGGFNPRRPVAVILHGLNGGSAEPLVMDFVHHATERLGWTCAVMIARGLAGVGNPSGVPFNGARTSDFAAALDLVRAAVPSDTPLVGVGYSMGAIVLAHYTAVAGAACPLACAICLSGSPDVRHGTMPHAQRLWQPALAHELKRTLLRLPCLHDGSGVRPVDTEHDLSSDCPHVTAFDEAVVVPHFGFDSLMGETGYYAAMSLVRHGQEANVSVPLLLVHACDDPIIDSRSYASVICSSNPNIWTRMTRHGGHVGWCEGWWPQPSRWSFMCRQVEEFADAVLADAYEQRPRQGRPVKGSQSDDGVTLKPPLQRPRRSPSRRQA